MKGSVKEERRSYTGSQTLLQTSYTPTPRRACTATGPKKEATTSKMGASELQQSVARWAWRPKQLLGLRDCHAPARPWARAAHGCCGWLVER